MDPVAGSSQTFPCQRLHCGCCCWRVQYQTLSVGLELVTACTSWSHGASLTQSTSSRPAWRSSQGAPSRLLPSETTGWPPQRPFINTCPCGGPVWMGSIGTYDQSPPDHHRLVNYTASQEKSIKEHDSPVMGGPERGGPESGPALLIAICFCHVGIETPSAAFLPCSILVSIVSRMSAAFFAAELSCVTMSQVL